MEFVIKGPGGDIIATALSACEARDVFRAGRRQFGGQAIFGPKGISCSELELEAFCVLENGRVYDSSGHGWRTFLT